MNVKDDALEKRWKRNHDRWAIIYEDKEGAIGSGFVFGERNAFAATAEAKRCLPPGAKILALFRHDIRTIELVKDYLCE